ncbi:hypothetical protein SO694_00086179 [Aureococcus anophagefferens]|uniref:EF-hand domain-containing protein n=1 Tax=Aureococcus anophagefferens TaxID=44056 RepID=A0ABR1G4F5_AURAN
MRCSWRGGAARNSHTNASSKVFDRDHVHRGSVTALNFAQGLSLKRASINAGAVSAKLPAAVRSVEDLLRRNADAKRILSGEKPLEKRSAWHREPRSAFDTSAPAERPTSAPAVRGQRTLEARRRRRRPRLNYFGQQAKREFFDLYKSMARQAEIVDDVGARVVGEERARLAAWSDDDGGVDDEASKSGSSCASSKVPAPEAATGVSDPSHSPRHRFARGIAAMMKRLRRPGATGGDPFCLPEPLFVRRAASDGLDLAHRAYGDDLAILTCSTAPPSTRWRGSSRRRPARSRSSTWTARRRDDEIRDLVRAVAKNATLKTLALSGNFLGGAAEKLANCAPEDRGAYAVAKALRTNATLTKLDLSWNQLGAQSGSLIGGALMKNRSLAWFSLAFNCIGDAGAMALGRALDANGAIQHLDVSSSGIRNRGAQVIAEGLRDNLRLTRLDMSGNPGHYDLDLDDPFQWMVAKQLIWLSVARGGQVPSLVEIDASSGGKPTKRSVTLVSRTPEADKPGAIGWEPGKKVEGPKAPISRERRDIRKLLDALDEDASGAISTAEFAEFVDKGDAAFFVKSPKKAKPAGFHAIVRQQSVKLQVDDGR